MDYQVVLLFIVTVINAVFSYFILKGPKNSTNILFSFVTLTVSFWSANLALFFLNDDFNKALLFANFYYVAAAAIPLLFFLFSASFLSKDQKLDSRYYFLASPFILLIIFLLFDKNFLLSDIFIDSYGKNVHFTDNHYWYYVAYFIFYVIFAYHQLFRKFVKSQTEIEIVQLKFVIVGTSISFALGMYFNLILPAVGNYEFIWLGPLFTLIMVLSIGYAIAKHNLFNIGVVATEIFTFAIWFLLLLRMLTAENLADKIINGFLLVFAIIFGILLIRTIIKEIRTRERIEGLVRDLAKANEHLRQMEQQKTEFVSIASHQLRTPLTAIKGYASMVLEGSFGMLTEAARGAVEKLFKSSQRLVSLVEDFLTLSKIERGKMEFEFAPVSLTALIGEIVHDLELNARDKGTRITVQSNDSLPAVARGDRLKLKQVFNNLIDNAIRYTNGGFIRVVITRDQEMGRVRTAISDTGIGMQPATLLRLFKRFDDELSAGKSDKLGMSPGGLGLYVSYRIIEAHHGRIWAESDGTGKGSTFFVELPS